MQKNLDGRLAKLEAVRGPSEIVVVYAADYGDGSPGTRWQTVDGLEVDDESVARLEAAADVQLIRVLYDSQNQSEVTQ